MAVIVQCFHCNTILELDEGFRGGVCRCSTCGSLLQVPKAASTAAPKERPAAPGAEAAQVNRPMAPAGEPGLSRGQFDAASSGSGGSGKQPAVPDFGGSSSGLRTGGRPAAPTVTAAREVRLEQVAAAKGAVRPAAHLKRVKKNNVLLVASFVMLGLVALASLVVALVILAHTEEKSGDRGVSASGGGSGKTSLVLHPGSGQPLAGNEQPPEVAPPHRVVTGFLDVPLTGKKIVLSIDGASSMSDNFDFVRRGVYQAIERLGPGQELQVAIWRESGVIPLPAIGFVGKAGLAKLKEVFDVVPVLGSSDAAACMKATLELGGDQVVFVTAKPEMDPMIASAVLEAVKGKVRLDSVKLDAEDTPSPLEELAKKTEGVFHFITGAELQEMVGRGSGN